EIAAPPRYTLSLPEAKYGFKTKLIRQESYGEAAPEPPPGLFRRVHYDAPLGKQVAYLSPDPGDAKRHPAIIWILGGDDQNSIGDVWSERPESDEQNASAFRKAGVVMMFPSLRGGNDNPGFREAFLGEVDDVVAAAAYLARQPFVDPDRIYLGGHSTGGTLVLLVAASTDRFRAVFSFGPKAAFSGYDDGWYLPFDTSDPRELPLRSPAYWLHSIRAPVLVFVGTVQDNLEHVQAMEQISTNAKVRFYAV